MAAIGSFFSSIFGSSAASQFFATAIGEMPAIVANVYKSIQGLMPPAPTSSAEVGVAKMIQEAMPALTATELTTVKKIYGEAVAQYITINPAAKLDDPTVWPAVQALADSGVTSLGLNPAQMSATLKSQLLTSAILVYQAGMGLAAINVAKQ